VIVRRTRRRRAVRVGPVSPSPSPSPADLAHAATAPDALAGGSTDVEERMLENSYHVATLDNDAPAIFAETVDFIRSTARSGVTR